MPFYRFYGFICTFGFLRCVSFQFSRVSYIHILSYYSFVCLVFHLSFISLVCLWFYFCCLLGYTYRHSLTSKMLIVKFVMVIQCFNGPKRWRSACKESSSIWLERCQWFALAIAGVGIIAVIITVDFFIFGFPYQATFIEFQQMIRILLFGLFGCNHHWFRLTFQQDTKFQLTIRLPANCSGTQKLFNLIVQCDLFLQLSFAATRLK